MKLKKENAELSAHLDMIDHPSEKAVAASVHRPEHGSGEKDGGG
jgi:hypothetical protein